MAEQRVSREQVDALANKLDKLGSELTGEERDLLLTVFGLAASAMGTAEEEAEVSGYAFMGGLPTTSFANPVPLSTGFQSAFFPGQAGRFQFGGAPSSEIGIQVSWSK